MIQYNASVRIINPGTRSAITVIRPFAQNPMIIFNTLYL